MHGGAHLLSSQSPLPHGGVPEPRASGASGDGAGRNGGGGLGRSRSHAALGGGRAAGAAAPTFTMASTKPPTRIRPQGALHRLGQAAPAGPKLPFLTAIIAAPKNEAGGPVPSMRLFHSESAPGYL